uniref:Acyl carrier protein n=1 Tax=Caulacanthus okamurae TaxID=152008 RepID=A0A6H1U7N8_9FLOR|nr:acyl carrier protein [Caulacanthus okamurae]QIZ74675.1 acyl carrier protein [Caulacanthus okamurae]
MLLTEKENNIFTKLKVIVVQQLSVKQEEVHLGSNFASDFKADSLDMVELVMAIEEEFDIDISDNDVNEIETVNDAVTFINKAID